MPWKKVREIVNRFEALNPYDKKVIPGSILNIVQELNFDSEGRQRLLYGYGISAKRYALYTQDESGIHLVKVSEHGLGLYCRPKEGRNQEGEVATWIREGWQWMLNRVLGLRCPMPGWFRLPVMRRIASPHQMLCGITSFATGSGATIQLRSVSRVGEPDKRSAHSLGPIRKRLIEMDEIAPLEHSSRHNSQFGESDAACSCADI